VNVIHSVTYLDGIWFSAPVYFLFFGSSFEIVREHMIRRGVFIELSVKTSVSLFLSVCLLPSPMKFKLLYSSLLHFIPSFCIFLSNTLFLLPTRSVFYYVLVGIQNRSFSYRHKLTMIVSCTPKHLSYIRNEEAAMCVVFSDSFKFIL